MQQTMQQRRPHSAIAIEDSNGINGNGHSNGHSPSRDQRRLERREAKKLREEKKTKRVKPRAASSWINDSYIQLAIFSFIIFGVIGVVIFNFMRDGEVASPNPVKVFEKKLQEKERKGSFFSKLRGGIKYVIPQSMQHIGCKKDWYLSLRREWDTEILPQDDERSLKWADGERKRLGIFKQSPDAETSYDINNCPEYPPQEYPVQWPVLDVLENWSPDDPTPHLEIYQGICIFDYGTDMHKANNYRQKELPFVVRNDPVAVRAAERWSHPDYMEKLLMGKEDVQRRTEYSPNNHFMYWVDRRTRDMRKKEHQEIIERRKRGEEFHDGYGRGNQEEMADAMREAESVSNMKDQLAAAKKLAQENPEDREIQEEWNRLKHEMDSARNRANTVTLEHWKPPTENLRMTYLDWLKHANVSDDKLGPNNPHWYFRLIGCGAMEETGEGNCDKGSSEWLFDELPHFQPRLGDERPFYMINPTKQQGIHCRFGMKGVIAENHFDLSRNAINVLFGQRRYILAHPNQCNNMNLLPRGHPSARHSAVDWSDPDLENFPSFVNAHVNEIVMQPGDVLYLPTNWFHYIISLDLNFQCNTRSGGENIYRKEITDCSF